MFALPVLAPGASTIRTPKGREAWSRLGGFRRVLSTPSSEARFDFCGRKELYTAYIPWAVAFGCAREWAEKYRVEAREEPPVPGYYIGGYPGMYGGAGSMADFANDFNTTMHSAISSYQATQTRPRAEAAAASPAAAAAAAAAVARGDPDASPPGRPG